jgi:hypothetical protein
MQEILPVMDKNLTVYPISSGDMLNIFANEEFSDVRIMDMAGNIVHSTVNTDGAHGQVNISALENATYIIEVVYVSNKTARSVFVKM